jgi:hypothetical protein
MNKDLMDCTSRCKYCVELAEDCTCQKLRLLLRKSIADYDGRCAENLYKTAIVFVPSKSKDIQDYEVIGGEWLLKEIENG